MSEKLSDVVTIISGGTPKTSVKEFWDGDIDWLAVADFNSSNRYVSSASKKITELGLNNSNTKMLEKGDLIISARGTVGAIAQLTKPMAFNQSCFGLRGKKDKLDTDYLYYWLKNYVDVLLNKSQGSVFNTINLSTFDDIKIELPSIADQRKISNLLTLLDDKIEINNQINQELETMAKTLYDYWFVQFDFPDKNGKPYKSSGGKMVYHPELKREIPEGWGVEKLGDITICHDSKRVPLSSNDRELVKGEIPYYGATGIMDYVNDYIFDGDYVLMAEDGSVMTEKGTPILQRISGKNWVNNHAHVLEPIKNYSCKLLMMLLKDVSVMKIKTGSIQMKINQENMNKIVVPAIPLELLSEINQKLEVIDKQQLNLIEENKQITQLRDWLLPMLMNGQVKVE